MKQVLQFERENEVILPEPLRNHLTEYGGRPQPCWVRCIKSDYFPDGLCQVDRLSGWPRAVVSISSFIPGRPTRKFVSIAASGDNGIWLETTDGADGPVFYQRDTSRSLAGNIRDNNLVKIHDNYWSFISSFEYHPRSLPWLPLLHARDYRTLAEWAAWARSTKKLNVRNEFEKTPLEEAAGLGDSTAVEILLANKAKLGRAAEVASHHGHRGLATRLRRAAKRR